MNTGKTVFSQIMEFLPLHEFRKCVERYHGDYKVQSFSCMDQYLCMTFAQLTYRESLRDIEPGSFYIMDRGYLDFIRLYALHLAKRYENQKYEELVKLHENKINKIRRLENEGKFVEARQVEFEVIADNTQDAKERRQTARKLIPKASSEELQNP